MYEITFLFSKKRSKTMDGNRLDEFLAAAGFPVRAKIDAIIAERQVATLRTQMALENDVEIRRIAD